MKVRQCIEVQPYYETEVARWNTNVINDDTHDHIQTHIVDYSSVIKSVKVENDVNKDPKKTNCFRGIFKFFANHETVDFTGIDFSNCDNFQYAFDSTGIIYIYVSEEGNEVEGEDFYADEYLFSKEKPTSNNASTITWLTQEDARAESSKEIFYESYKLIKDGDRYMRFLLTRLNIHMIMYR